MSEFGFVLGFGIGWVGMLAALEWRYRSRRGPDRVVYYGAECGETFTTLCKEEEQ